MIDPVQATAEIERNLQSHLQNREWEMALGKLRALELVGKHNPELERALLGIIDFMDALRAKNYTGAAKTSKEGWALLKLTTLGLDESVAALIEAEQNWREGENKIRDALQKATHILTKAEAENQMGVLAAILEQRDAARSHFQAALANDPRHYRAMTNLGNLELEAGHLQEAESRYREVIRLNSDYSVVYNNLAAVMKKQGKRSEAVTMLKKAQSLSVREMRGDTKGTAVGRQKSPLGDWFAKPSSRWVLAGLILLVAFLVSRR
ncbi:MAG: tetratricopeptide repeat protein [Deinococcales bacterium]